MGLLSLSFFYRSRFIYHISSIFFFFFFVKFHFEIYSRCFVISFLKIAESMPKQVECFWRIPFLFYFPSFIFVTTKRKERERAKAEKRMKASNKSFWLISFRKKMLLLKNFADERKTKFIWFMCMFHLNDVKHGNRHCRNQFPSKKFFQQNFTGECTELWTI